MGTHMFGCGSVLRRWTPIVSCILLLLWDACGAQESRVRAQVPNERISNMDLKEFRDTFEEQLRGRRVESTEIGPGIYLYRIADMGPGDFLIQKENQRPKAGDKRRVLYSEPNYVVTIRMEPAAANGQTENAQGAVGCSYDAESALSNKQYGLKITGAMDVWNKGYRGSGSVVAVVDTGIYRHHPDLAANLWHATQQFEVDYSAPLASSPSPMNSQAVTCSVGASGYDATTPSCDSQHIDDVSGHGTHVAGIIAARGTDCVTGVAPNAQLLVVRAFTVDANGNVSGEVAHIIRAYSFILQMKRLGVPVRIVNNSWGFYGSGESSLNEMVSKLSANSILTVAAADDAEIDHDASSTPAYYLTHLSSPSVIGVSATDDDDVAVYAWGKNTIDLRAPGYTIYSTLPPEQALAGFNSGTSMATPFVSGAAALVLNACPGLSVEELKAALTESVDQIIEGPVAAPESTKSGGRLNVLSAVKKCRAR